MASSNPGDVRAVQVGSYFVTQYYQILQKQPDVVHQFYFDGSSMIRVDGDSTKFAAGILNGSIQDVAKAERERQAAESDPSNQPANGDQHN
ncbi:hypothetical protein ACFX2B_000368 [Malus domestica]